MAAPLSESLLKVMGCPRPKELEMHYVDGFELWRECQNELLAEAEMRRLARTARTARRISFRRIFPVTALNLAIRAMGAKE